MFALQASQIEADIANHPPLFAGPGVEERTIMLASLAPLVELCLPYPFRPVYHDHRITARFAFGIGEDRVEPFRQFVLLCFDGLLGLCRVAFPVGALGILLQMVVEQRFLEAGIVGAAVAAGGVKRRIRKGEGKLLDG